LSQWIAIGALIGVINAIQILAVTMTVGIVWLVAEVSARDASSSRPLPEGGPGFLIQKDSGNSCAGN